MANSVWWRGRLTTLAWALVRLSLALFLALSLAVPALAATLPLVAIREVRALSPEKAAENPAVRIEVVVTCFVPGWNHLFVHDGSDGIAVAMSVKLCQSLPPLPPGTRVRVDGLAEAQPRPSAGLPPGTRVRVDGVAQPGGFAPSVTATGIEVLGVGASPSPRPLTAAELYSPALDCQWVEANIVVRTIGREEGRLVCDVEIEGARAQVFVWQTEPFEVPEWLAVERSLRLRGVAATVFNGRRQMTGRYFHVPGFASLHPAAELTQESAAPLHGIDELLRWGEGTQRQRVRVRGAVTAVFGGAGIFLRGAGGSLFVRSAKPPALAVGDLIEVEGYPELAEFAPNLRAVAISKLAAGLPSGPSSMSAETVLASQAHHDLLQVEGELIEIIGGRGRTTFVCRSGRNLFEAALENPLMPPGLIPGMTLRLTGICTMAPDPLGYIFTPIRLFTLQLRSPADLEVISRPPWWTARRILWLLAATASVAAFAAFWALALRRQVNAQTALIRTKVKRESILEERGRIARELHDTLEQELLGVNMLVDHAAARLTSAPGEKGVAHTLTLAAGMLRHCREESRTSIRDLRSVALEKLGLPAALDELLRPLAVLGHAQYSVTVSGSPRPLGHLVETALLRLAHEAVANAARHSHADHIGLDIAYEEGTVSLRVRDDGCGFTPHEAEAAAGHFGLRGMRERVRKIGAEMIIESAARLGTTVTITTPAP